jgi:hypothetical protein
MKCAGSKCAGSGRQSRVVEDDSSRGPRSAVVRQSCNSLSRRNLSAFWPRLNLVLASPKPRGRICRLAVCNPAVSTEHLAPTRWAPFAGHGELVPLSIPSAAGHALVMHLQFNYRATEGATYRARKAHLRRRRSFISKNGAVHRDSRRVGESVDM